MTDWLPIVLAGSTAAFLAAPTGEGALRLAAVLPVRRPGVAPAIAGLTVLVAVSAFLAAGVLASLLGCLGLLVVHRAAGRRRRAADAHRERARALDALSLLAADLRAGRTPADALAAAAEIACGESGGALRSAAAASRLGGDVASALVAERSAVAATLRALGACWEVCSDAGSGLAAAVERLEEAMRAAEAQRRTVAAELAGPRATGQLLAALPLVGLALAAALGAQPLDLLLGTPFGIACLLIGLTLDGLGLVWTRRLADAAMP